MQVFCNAFEPRCNLSEFQAIFNIIYFIVSAESYCKVKNTLPNTFIVYYLSQYMRKNRKTVFQLSVSRKTNVNVNNLSIKAVRTIDS